MAKPLIDPLQWNAAIVDPSTGFPTDWFMRQFSVQRGNADDLSKLFTIELIAGTALSGGGVLGDLANLTFNLENTAVTPGVYGDAANVSQITVDAQGRITAAANVPLASSGGGFFSGATGTFSTGSTTAFASKAIVFTPSSNIEVDFVLGFVQAAAGGETYRAQIATHTAGTVGTVLATSSDVSTIDSSVHAMRFPFSTPVALTAGTSYLLIVVNAAGGGTTACRVTTANTSTSVVWSTNAPGTITGPASRFSYNTINVTATQAPSSTGTTYDKFGISIEGRVV